MFFCCCFWCCCLLLFCLCCSAFALPEEDTSPVPIPPDSCSSRHFSKLVSTVREMTRSLEYGFFLFDFGPGLGRIGTFMPEAELVCCLCCREEEAPEIISPPTLLWICFRCCREEAALAKTEFTTELVTLVMCDGSVVRRSICFWS